MNPGNRPTDRASLHHFMYRSASHWPEMPDDAAFFDWRRSSPCEIGHDSWIGHGAIVLPGRRVGACVGAGTVIAHDVAPHQIVAGSPARPIRARHPSEVAERLMRFAWWDWDHARLRDALEDFRTLSAEAFLEKHGG